MNTLLENIEITNFKSIRHQKIEGCKRINVFIGYPNVGKSNILEALSFLSFLNDNNCSKISKICRVENMSELFFDGNLLQDIILKYGKSTQLKIAYKSNSELILKNITNSEGSGFVERVIDAHKDKEGFNDFSLGQSNLVNNNPKLLIKKYEFQKNIAKNVVGYDALYYPDGQNLFSIVETNSELRRELIALLANYNLKLFFDKTDNYTMKVMKTLSDETVFTIPFHQIADTLQRLIFYKAAIHTNKNTALLFEEPEAHMFPPYVKMFANDVISDEGKNQFFIATHSPYVLDALLEDAAEEVSVYLVDYKNGETIINNLSAENIAEIRDYGVDLFFNIENYLNK